MKPAFYPLAAGLAIFALAGCGTTRGTGGSDSSAASIPPANPPSASPSPTVAAVSCQTQFLTWAKGGGVTKFHALAVDLGKVAKAGENLGPRQAANRSLVADSKAFLADLPPACIPGMRTDLATGLNDLIASAKSADKGDPTDLLNSLVESARGAIAIQRATADMNKFVNSTARDGLTSHPGDL